MVPTKCAYLLGLAALMILSATPSLRGQNTAAYREKLVAMKKYGEAFAAYREATAQDPQNADLLYNTGLMAYLSGQAKEAVAYWSRLKVLEPNAWRVSSKLIQAYEAAGQVHERDRERAALYKLRNETKDDELRKLKFYVRDQFSVGKTKLMVVEYFDLAGNEPIRFSFDILGAEGEPVKTRYTLGSYETTTAIARDLQEIKATERLFHLDCYKDDGAVHESYGFFVNEPTYDRVKASVKDILLGKRKALSGTSRQP
jgi:tetratricopeptide (TPR) repeat protein